MIPEPSRCDGGNNDTWHFERKPKVLFLCVVAQVRCPDYELEY